MRIGFTGSRRGLSKYQKEQLELKLINYFVDNQTVIGIHGGCVGADIEFHELIKKYGGITIVFPGHSRKNPEDTKYRGDYNDATIIHESKPFLARNITIANSCDVLLACPFEKLERGGTWRTINYSKNKDFKTIIIKRKPIIEQKKLF